MTAARRPDDPPLPMDEDLLSDLLDGEVASAAAVEQACRRWRSDDQWRARWTTYQLIGDVLRSDELAGDPARDRAFLQSLRARLADEPIPLAPAPLPAPARPARWVATAAVVAGFVVVGAAVVSLAPATQGPAGWDERMVQARPQPLAEPLTRRVSAAAVPASAQTLVIDGQVIRDARLDAYFEAHRGALGASPSALPGGALRSVEILLPQR